MTYNNLAFTLKRLTLHFPYSDKWMQAKRWLGQFIYPAKRHHHKKSIFELAHQKRPNQSIRNRGAIESLSRTILWEGRKRNLQAKDVDSAHQLLTILVHWVWICCKSAGGVVVMLGRSRGGWFWSNQWEGGGVIARPGHPYEVLAVTPKS